MIAHPLFLRRQLFWILSVAGLMLMLNTFIISAIPSPLEQQVPKTSASPTPTLLIHHINLAENWQVTPTPWVPMGGVRGRPIGITLLGLGILSICGLGSVLMILAVIAVVIRVNRRE